MSSSRNDQDSPSNLRLELPLFVPMEVRNVIEPVPLTADDTMRFRCHPGVTCFNACCHKIDIVLTPYDMIRLRRRLRLEPEEFLFRYARPMLLNKGGLPVAMIRINEADGRCPFNTDAGCSVYVDRPVACRYYPIGMALLHKQEQRGNEEFYFMIKEEFCQGHHDPKTWTVREWRADQGVDAYDAENRGWMEMVLKRRSAGDLTQTSLALAEMFYTASTNPPTFQRFMLDSSFLRRYAVAPEVVEEITRDEVALTRFAFEWLESVLFGDKKVTPRPEAIEEVRERKLQHAAELREKLARGEVDSLSDDRIDPLEEYPEEDE